MGIDKNGYYSLKDIEKHNATYNIIYSTRSDGKSYAVKKKGLTKAWKSKTPSFGLIRRYKDDIETSLVNAYFVERGKNLIEEITGGKCNCIDYFRKFLWFSKTKPDGKIEHVQKCGEVFALSVADKRYKSTGHAFITDLVFEEVLTSNDYLKNEPEKLMQLVSTCARNDNITVYLIGNTISRVCPYFKDWGLVNIRTQKIGTIDDYLVETGEFDDNGKPIKVKVSVEYSQASPHKSKMFFGRIAKSIQGGAWETHDFAKLPDVFEAFEVCYELTYKSISDFTFTLKLLCHKEKGYLIVFVYPAKHIKERIICGAFSTEFLTTPTLNKDIKAEVIIHNLIIDNKICYSDNLTGEDFQSSIKAETVYPF